MHASSAIRAPRAPAGLDIDDEPTALSAMHAGAMSADTAASADGRRALADLTAALGLPLDAFLAQPSARRLDPAEAAKVQQVLLALTRILSGDAEAQRRLDGAWRALCAPEDPA